MSERGAITFGPIVGIIVIVLAIVGLFAICNEEESEVDSLGRTVNEQAVSLKVPVNHEYERDRCWDGDCGGQNYEDQWSNEDRNRNRGRNRGAFSPGPFDDSPVDAFNRVCMPGATCYYDGRHGDEPPPEEGPA